MSLALDAYNVAESDGNVSVCAVLLGGELAREVAVNITTTDTTIGTAAGACIRFWKGYVCYKLYYIEGINLEAKHSTVERYFYYCCFTITILFGA